MKKYLFLTTCFALCSACVLYGGDPNPLRAKHKAPKPFVSSLASSPAGAATKPTVHAYKGFKEVVVPNTFADERTKGFPALQQILGKGSTKPVCKKGRCNLGLYIHTPKGAGKESFLKVISGAGYAKEKKAIELIYRKKANNFIMVPHHVFLFKDRTVFAMDRAPGESLDNIEMWRKMPREGLENLARMVNRMLELNLYHSDFHRGNFLYDATSTTWKVVDTNEICAGSFDHTRYIGMMMKAMHAFVLHTLLFLESPWKASTVQKYLFQVADIVQKNDELLRAVFKVFPARLVERYKKEKTEHAKNFLHERVKKPADKAALKAFYKLAWPQRIEHLMEKAHDIGDPHALNADSNFFSRRNYINLGYLLSYEYFVKPLL